MIRKIFVLIATLSSVVSLSQSDVDAMQYSQTSFYGDARYMSMGGAFGSLGANISCINNNPAGIAMYHKGELVFTPGVKLQGENATHYGTNASDFSGKINISNLGFVAAWDQKQTPQNYNQQNNTDRYGPGSNQAKKQSTSQQTKTDRWALGLNFNRIADFNYHSTINGYATPGSSIMNSMASAANGYTGSELLDGQNYHQFYEGLGYYTGAIVPVQAGTLNYDTTVNASHYAGSPAYDDATDMSLQQTKTIQASGRVGEFAIALAHSFNDKLYIGGGIGVPVVKYNYQAIYTEYDYKNRDPYFNNLQYQENLATTGAGINFKGGAIYRFNSGVKIGLYAQSPTYYKLTDNYQNSMITTYDSAFINDGYGGLTNVASYTSAIGTNTYHLNTPGRVGLSASYVVGKIIAFSIDGEYINYSQAKFSDASGYLNSNVNPVIQKNYTGTANLKAGLEINTRPIVFRAGFASYGSPVGNVLTGNSVRNSFTGGIGFRSARSVYFDLGFVYTVWKEQYYVIDPAYVQASNVKYNTMYITATLGIKFN